MSTDKIPSDEECVRMLWNAGCTKRVVVHCATVRAVAVVIAAGIGGADTRLVSAGALLHDIGRSQTHSVMHAPLGAQIVEANGCPKSLVEIVRKHTGAGLDAEDVRELGLPPGDYMPSTLEEKVVAHADNLVSNDTVVPHRRSVDKLVSKGAQRGADRIEALHRELSGLYGEDLDCMPGLLGAHPKLIPLRKHRRRGTSCGTRKSW